MASNLTFSGARKITVTLPEDLLVRLDTRIPPRQRSRFIAAAIESQLTIAEQIAALEETAGVWTDENHSDMLTDEGIDNWLQNIRQSWVTINDHE
jgi:metal-responsive CopG/Arc/MetJ family transcriptional regulator